MADDDNIERQVDVEVTFTGSVELDIPRDMGPVLFGDEDVTDKLWALAGAFDGGRLRVRRSTTGTEAGPVECIDLRFQHEYLRRPMERKLFTMEDGSGAVDTVENVEFSLKPDYQGYGIGTQSLQVEAATAHELGFAKIVAVAAGYDGHPDYVGYRVWPKLGYDVEVPRDVAQKMPAEELKAVGIDPDGSFCVSDLLDRDVYHLWERFGAGCIMEFDVSSLHSWSMRQLFGQDEQEQ